MIKSVFREIFIMLLLCVAIVLVLGVVFYDYIPSNKAIPNKLEAYTTPENVKEEIDQIVPGYENTAGEPEEYYEITGADLNLYKQTNSYIPGKPDPFSASPIADANTEDGNLNEPSGGGTTSGGSTNQTVDPNSTGTFFNNTGLK